uniref:Myosin heavy chain n=2 Tax=Parascaris univalens TaxID=6257 RepID=A0A915A537_PARUN
FNHVLAQTSANEVETMSCELEDCAEEKIAKNEHLTELEAFALEAAKQRRLLNERESYE